MSKDVHDNRYEGQNKTDKEPFSTSSYGGFFVEIPASEKLLLDLGAMYTNYSTIGKGKTMLHRIDVPLAIKYDISGLRPKVGGYVSYIPGVTSFENKYRSLTRKDIEKFDYGALFGLEYNFNEKYFIDDESRRRAPRFARRRPRRSAGVTSETGGNRTSHRSAPRRSPRRQQGWYWCGCPTRFPVQSV